MKEREREGSPGGARHILRVRRAHRCDALYPWPADPPEDSNPSRKGSPYLQL